MIMFHAIVGGKKMALPYQLCYSAICLILLVYCFCFVKQSFCTVAV